MALVRVQGSVWDSNDNIIVNLISDLANVEQEGMVIVRGYNQVNDGGGGTFTYDAVLARSLANGGTIIDVTGTKLGFGVWVRDYNLSQFCLNWFGVDEDTTDNLLAAYGINNAIVTIASPDNGGTFVFDNSEISNHDGFNNINGWIRTYITGLAGIDDYVLQNNLDVLLGITKLGNGIYANGVTYTAYSEYLLDDAVPFVPNPDTVLPYITNTSTYPNALDDPNLIVFELGNVNTSPIFEEIQVLTDGQLIVTFVSTVVTQGSFYIAGSNIDRGRLSNGVDYTIIDSFSIQLTKSYPAGTRITGINNDITGVPVGFVLERVNEAAIIADQSLIAGQIVFTEGKITSGDQDGAPFLISPNGTPTGPNDLDMDSGLVAVRQDREAVEIAYDNTDSTLSATEVKSALDDLDTKIEAIPPIPTIFGFTGQITMAGMLTPPTGWLLCDGAAVSRTTYSDLFATIGTTWGNGNGTTTFNIPDCNLKFFRGTTGGSRAVASTESGTPGPHTHFTINSDRIYATGEDYFISATNSIMERNSGSYSYLIKGTGKTPTKGKTSTDGGSETRPTNTAIPYMIKT